MISAEAPQQTQEIGSKKVLGAYPAHTPKCFPGHFGAPPQTWIWTTFVLFYRRAA